MRELKSGRVIFSKSNSTRSHQEITKGSGLKRGVETDTGEYKKETHLPLGKAVWFADLERG